MIEHDNCEKAIKQHATSNADIHKSSPSSNVDRLPYKTIVNDSGYVDLISNSDSFKNTTVSQHKVDLCECSLESESHGGPSPVQSEHSSTTKPERSLSNKTRPKGRKFWPNLDTPCKRASFIVACIALALVLMAGVILIIIFGISKSKISVRYVAWPVRLQAIVLRIQFSAVWYASGTDMLESVATPSNGFKLFCFSRQVPCSLARCHKYASVCVNHAFRAECVCDYGFNGNGKEYCDGNLGAF